MRAKSSPGRIKKENLKEIQFHEVTLKQENLQEMKNKFNKVESKLDTNLQETKWTLAREKEEN